MAPAAGICDDRWMRSIRTAAIAFGALLGIATGWACGLGSCELAKCGGGFQFDLKVDAPDSDPITLEIEAENGRSTWDCDPGNSRCSRASNIDGDRDFDPEVTMTVPNLLTPGVCDATACIRIHIAGDDDDEDEDEGTYGPDRVVVRIIDDDGEEYSREFAPEYDRTEDYGGEGCPYCDSLESFDERVTVD